MLLYEGSQIYFGSTKLAVDYFLDLGFEKPARATIADFLTSITNPAERRIRDGYSDRVPRSAAEFASAWTMSLMGQALSKSVMVAEDKIRIGYPQAKSNTYKLPTVPQIRLCIHRGFQRLRNHFAPPVAGVVGNTIIAIVVGSVYYNLGEDTASMDRRAVLVFFSLMINAYAPAFDVGSSNTILVSS